MPRYISQRRKTSCGPVAIMNAVKWAGYSLSREEYFAHYAKLCKYKVGSKGTCDLNLETAIRETPEIELMAFIDNPKLRDLDYCLDKGCSAIVAYFHEKGGHYIFMPKRTPRFYYAVNATMKESALARYSRKNISKKLRFKYEGVVSSRAWIVGAVE